jgi:hypothetical protein
VVSTPRVTWSLIRVPFGRRAGVRAIAVASACLRQADTSHETMLSQRYCS